MVECKHFRLDFGENRAESGGGVDLEMNLILSAFSWCGLKPTNSPCRVAVAYTSASITSVLLVAVLLYHMYKYTNLFSKLPVSFNFQKIRFHTQRKQPHNQAECDNGFETEVVEIREKNNILNL